MPRRAAFTLIELMIVVVIIGVLAAIAIPKFGKSRESAYVSQIKSDLRNLAAAQETYYQDYQVYAVASSAGLTSKSGVSTWKPSTGTIVIAGGTTASANGWSAQVGHPSSTTTCSLFRGTGASGAFAASGQADGDVVCY